MESHCVSGGRSQVEFIPVSCQCVLAAFRNGKMCSVSCDIVECHHGNHSNHNKTEEDIACDVRQINPAFHLFQFVQFTEDRLIVGFLALLI